MKNDHETDLAKALERLNVLSEKIPTEEDVGKIDAAKAGVVDAVRGILGAEPEGVKADAKCREIGGRLVYEGSVENASSALGLKAPDPEGHGIDRVTLAYATLAVDRLYSTSEDPEEIAKDIGDDIGKLKEEIGEKGDAAEKEGKADDADKGAKDDSEGKDD